MSKTKIEWCDYSINPVKGLCPMACPYCYARRMYKRFKWNPEIRMEPDWAEDLPKKPTRVFVGSTIELFGDWVEEWMWDSIWQYVNDYPQHTFIFLTKQPQNLARWPPFPPNVWGGLSVDGTPNAPLHRIYNGFNKVQATVKFLSFEPLLAQTKLDPRDLEWAGVSWVICGQQTPVKASTMPQIGWIREIVETADIAGIPVFLKENLISCVDQYEFALKDGKYRQEFPVVSHDCQGKK